MSGDAVDADDISLAAERLGQPFGRLHRPPFLVDADVDRVFRRDLLVGGDDENALLFRLGDNWIESGRAVRIDQDRVDPFIDEVAQLSDLTGDVDSRALGVGLHSDAFGLPCRSRGLRFVDHLGAPFAAYPAVAETDEEGILGACGESRCAHDRRNAGRENETSNHLHTPLVCPSRLKGPRLVTHHTMSQDGLAGVKVWKAVAFAGDFTGRPTREGSADDRITPTDAHRYASESACGPSRPPSIQAVARVVATYLHPSLRRR